MKLNLLLERIEERYCIAIILMGKRELVAMLNLSSWCPVMVELLFLPVPQGCLRFMMWYFLIILTYYFCSCGQIIFEKSLITGQLSKDCKTAKVSPLFKRGERSDSANYRPISLNCILCKVMEHVVASNLTQHLNKNNILYKLQHGFRVKLSCKTQLIQLAEDLGRQLKKGQQVDIVLLDFSKVLNKVSHLKLQYKLSSHGVKGKPLYWIGSFLGG